MTYYNCTDGEALDAICRDYYGYSRGSVEIVLSHEYNRDLAKKLPILNHGDVVYLPQIDSPPIAPVKSANLWS